MRTNFRPRSSRPNRSRTILIVCLLVVCALAAKYFKAPLSYLAEPLWKARGAAGAGLADVRAIFSSKTKLADENTALKAQLASVSDLTLSCRAIVDSREELLNTFGRTGELKGIAASVLVRPPETAYDLIIIDAGTSEGVHIGDKVHLPEGGALGQVSEVFTHTSKVALYTSPDNQTPAVLERNSIPVTITGRGGGSFEFNAPRGLTLVAGDKVLSPLLTGEMLGVIKDVSASPTDSFQHILVEGVGNISTLRFVLVSP